MSQLMWVRSHVRQLLQEDWNVPELMLDDDGDVMFRRGTAACWVTVLHSDPVMVRVFAHAALGVKPSAKLLRELNDAQVQSLSTRIELNRGLVIVSQTISPVDLTRPVLAQAVDAVGAAADNLGILLAAYYGGTTPFPVELEIDQTAR